MALGFVAAIVMGNVYFPAKTQAAKSVEVSHASVHDPSIVYCKEDGKYYIFGSHQAVECSKDLINWESTDKQLYRKETEKELKKSFEWAGYNDGSTNAGDGMALWAPCVIYNPYYEKSDGSKGSYMIYYPASSNYKRGCIGYAVSDKVAEGYKYVDTILYSGFTRKGGKDETYCKKSVDTSYERTNLKKLIEDKRVYFNSAWLTDKGGYNIGEFPQAIDPTVFFDADENLWMVYGSHGGGIWLLPLDRATGQPKFLTREEAEKSKEEGRNADPYFGYQLASYGEGPYIMYDKESKTYILSVTYGQITDGYNQRLFKSDDVKGLYRDYRGDQESEDNEFYDTDEGNAIVYDTKKVPQDSVGLKLMGNYKLKDTPEYKFGGHNSLINVNGQMFNIYHQRFGDSASFSDRVHQMFKNEKGWYCMSVYEYSGDKFKKDGYSMDEMAGCYQFVNHGCSTNSSTKETFDINLNEDGAVTGALNGTWSYTEGTSYMSMKINDVRYYGVFFKQQDESGKKHQVMTFTAIGYDVLQDEKGVYYDVCSNAEAIWGSRYDEKQEFSLGNIKSLKTDKPIYSFDFNAYDNYMVENTGSVKTSAILWYAIVTEDEFMGTYLSANGDSSIKGNRGIKLSENAFSGLKDGLSVGFWTKLYSDDKKESVLFQTKSDSAAVELRCDGTVMIKSDGKEYSFKGDIDFDAGEWVVDGKNEITELDSEFASDEWTYIGLSVSKDKALLYSMNSKGKKVSVSKKGQDFSGLFDGKALANQDNYFANGDVFMDNIEVYAKALTEEDFDKKYDKNYSWQSDWKIDFGPAGSPQWETYTMMHNTTVYKNNVITQSYGFTEEIDAMETASGGNKIRDFVYKAGGEKYTFKIDLPNGTYSVFVYSGNKEADNTLNFFFNDESDKVYTQKTPEGVGSDNYGGENTYETYVNNGALSITFWGDEKLGEDAVTGALNSLEIVKVSDKYPEPKTTPTSKLMTQEDMTERAAKKSGGYDIPWAIIIITLLGAVAGGVFAIVRGKSK